MVRCTLHGFALSPAVRAVTWALLLGMAATPSAHAASSLRFHGNGAGDIDRVKIRVDDPATSLPGPPADVGATDFTIEFWMKAGAAENTAAAVGCGDNIAWIYGNIVMDRDRFNQDRKFGLSVAGGVLVFGVSGDGTGDRTLCGTTTVLDGRWHHVAVQRRRSDGWMWLFVDGRREADEDGPDGDVSYPDDGVPGDYCGGPCLNSDPFLVFGAEKHDAGSAFPSYGGWLDEIRLSDVLRYSSDFTPGAVPFVPDANTVALYHLDEGAGDLVGDSSGAAGGPSDGERRFGGSPAGPEWSAETFNGGTTGVGGGAPSGRLALSVRPNPARGAVTIQARGDFGAAPPPLAIYDVAGRRVALPTGSAVAGGVEYLWRAEGRDAARGVYLAIVRAGGAALTGSLVLR